MPRTLLKWRMACVALMAAEPLLSAQAADPVPGCPQTQPVQSSVPDIAARYSSDDNPLIYIDADRAISQINAISTFSGNVKLRRGSVSIGADTLTYDRADNHVDAQGNISLQNEAGDIVKTPILKYRLDQQTGYTGSAQFHLADNGARGEAKSIRFNGKKGLVLDDMRYTTCPAGHDDWLLSGSHLDLDRITGVGTAHNVVLRFMHVPILYSPYFSFPLTDQRKTGFLAPRFGNSTTLGTFLAAPYYVNIAPNYDATITPRIMSRRGFQLQNELRYLGSGYSGTAELEYLPHDQVTGDSRAGAFLKHNQILSPYWSGSADLEWVSDQTYFADLNENTAFSSQTYLPRLVQLVYGGPVWQFATLMSDYQTIDPTIPASDQPYKQLPEFQLSGSSPSPPDSLHLQLNSEWDYFERSSSVVGQRLDVNPSISLPLRNSYAFFIPKAGVRYTGYDLKGNGVADPADTTPQRTLPIYSLDSGLQFDRRATWSRTAYTQTLEPRIYYLYIPYRNQDALPLFDAGQPEFSFDNLFRENRFIGADRVGDADQTVLAVSSRFLEENSGIERLRLSIGKIVYFRDPKIVLPESLASSPAAVAADSVGEVRARLAPDWYMRSGLQWDSHQDTNQKGEFLVQYHPAKDRIVNIGYRYTRDQEAQSDVSAQWPLSGRWTGLARWNYSLLDNRTLQGYVGLQYRSCCWALQAIKQHRILPGGTIDNSIVFQLELTGLGNLGTPVESPLRQGRFMFQ